MSEHTERTRAWLDRHVAAREHESERDHRPLYRAGGRVGPMPVMHVVNLARTYSILRALSKLRFETCLDVGAGSGRLAHLIEHLFAVRCAGVDLSAEFAGLARHDFGLPVHVANAGALPFHDEQFDLVICSEVLEHVEHPFAVLSEVHRVARRAVVITTQESCPNASHRRLKMLAAERDAPHADRNYTIPDDFRLAFGARVEAQALLRLPERIRKLIGNCVDSLAACLRVLTEDLRLGPGSFGLLVLAPKAGDVGSLLDASRFSANRILESVIELDRRFDSPCSATIPTRRYEELEPVCPACRSPLEPRGETSVHCGGCGGSYSVCNGIPLLLAPPAVEENERRWAARPELAPLVRALRQPPLRSAFLRGGLRAVLRIYDFAALPLSWSEKLRLARLFRRWPRVVGDPS